MRVDNVGWCALSMLVVGAVSFGGYLQAIAAPAPLATPSALPVASAPELELLEYLGALAAEGSEWIGPEDMSTDGPSASQAAVAVARRAPAGAMPAKPSAPVQDNDD